MANVMFAWELGGGQGHLVPHRELLHQLAERGHQVHVVTRDLVRAAQAFSGLRFRYWQAPIASQPPERIFEPTVSLTHILHNVGFASVTEIAARLAAWHNLIDVIRPDLLLADYSPTALLASRRRRVRSIAVGTGFCVPPRVQPLQAFATLRHLAQPQQLAADEARLVTTINEALAHSSSPAIASLADVFHSTDAQWLTTLPELDHYPDRGSAEFWGLAPERPGVPAQSPPGDRRRVFGYLKPFPHVENLLELLNRLELPTVIACDGLSVATRQKHASRTLSFAPPHVDLAQMARECHLAITNGNHTTTMRFLLEGKPVVMIPLHLEQELVAHAVQSHRLGVTVRLKEPRDVYSQMAEILNTPTYHQSATAFAAKYAGQFGDRLEMMVATVESLLAQ